MAYQAEARIVCRIFGTSGDVSIGAKGSAPDRQPGFNAVSITQRLFAVPAAAAGQVPDNDKDACFTKAKDFIGKELPITYALDSAGAIATPGHAWIDGRWVPIGGSYTSYAFPLTLNGLPVEQESVLMGAGGTEQTITLSWWVVIQPK